MQHRPSHKELAKKLKAAMAALSNSSGLFANPAKAVSEMMYLNIGDSDDVWKRDGLLYYVSLHKDRPGNAGLNGGQ